MALKDLTSVVLNFICILFTSHYYHKLLLVVTSLRKENFAKGKGGRKKEKKNLTDKHSFEIWQMLSFPLLCVGNVQMLPEHLKILTCLHPFTLPTKTLPFCDVKRTT